MAKYMFSLRSDDPRQPKLCFIEKNRCKYRDIKKEINLFYTIRKVALPHVRFTLQIRTAQENLTLLLRKIHTKFFMQQKIRIRIKPNSNPRLFSSFLFSNNLVAKIA